MLLVSLYVLFWPNHPGGSTHLLGADKVVHALLFGALAATARWRFGGRAGVLAAVVAYAAGSELVQALLLSTRSGDVWDLVADALGALAGWLLAGRRPLS